MEKEKYRITLQKIRTTKESLWEGLKQKARKTRDIDICQRIITMIKALEDIECNFIDTFKPEKR